MWKQLFANTRASINIYDTDREKTNRLREFGESLGLNVIPAESAMTAIRDANLIIPVTTAEEPYIKSDWIGEGSLYCGVSLLDPQLDVFLRSDYIVVDDEESCKREGRPLQMLQEMRQLQNLKLYSMGEMLSGTVQLPNRGNEKVLFNPMGTIITDLVIAQSLFSRALEQGLGLILPS
jgi:ornithine cyclodeaminase